MTVTTTRMPVEIALANTETHDCEFTRGFWIGVAMVMSKTHKSFYIRVPESLVDDIRTALNPTNLVVGEAITNVYGVPFALLRIWKAN